MNRDEHRSHVAESMLEKELQVRTIALAEDLGWMVYHTHDSRRSQSGWPDLALVHPRKNQFMVRELKTMRGKASKTQRAWLTALNEAGVDSGIWNPEDLITGRILSQLNPRE